LPTWGGILQEHKEYFEKEKKLPYDFVRRKYLKKLNDYTKRNTILYATGWLQQPNAPTNTLSITDEDIQGFMEAVHGLTDDHLDLILHSPGGALEATEGLVKYLRSKFKEIRVIIPLCAMSAATMLACSANEIVMGAHSFIGPIDPQMSIRARNRQLLAPAMAITEQFEMAKEECKKDARNIGVWLPIIEQYGPALLKQCEHASKLAKELVAEWLKTYMFANTDKREAMAERIAATLSDHLAFKSHGRHIGISEAKNLGLNITDLEQDQMLQDLVLSVFHSTTQAFDGTPAVKIIENHNGVAFVKKGGLVSIRPIKPKKPPSPPSDNPPK
jgi:ATP-dependent protease ClpP protease subunit